jgi:hypothetical protein
MKIALVLLSCLVAVSYQQRFAITPRIGYLPYWYGVLPNGQHVLLDSEVMKTKFYYQSLKIYNVCKH